MQLGPGGPPQSVREGVSPGRALRSLEGVEPGHGLVEGWRSGGGRCRSRRWGPAPSLGAVSGSSMAMAAHLGPQLIGDRGGQAGDLGRVDPPGTVQIDRVGGRHPARAGW